MIGKQRPLLAVTLVLGGLASGWQACAHSQGIEPTLQATQIAQAEENGTMQGTSEEGGSGDAASKEARMKALRDQLPSHLDLPADLSEEELRSLVKHFEEQEANAASDGADSSGTARALPPSPGSSGGGSSNSQSGGSAASKSGGTEASEAGANASSGSGGQGASSQGPPSPGGSRDLPPSPPAPSGGSSAQGDNGSGGDSADEGEQMVQALNMPDMPLQQALDFYAHLTDRIILRRTDLLNNVPESIVMVTNQALTKSEAIEAFKTVFAMNGIALIPVGEKFLKVVSIDKAKSAAPDFSGASANDLAETGQFMTRVVELEHAPVEEAANLLTQFKSDQVSEPVVGVESTQTLILRDLEPNVKRMLQMVEKIDVEISTEIEMEVIPIKYALAEEVAQVLGTLTPGGAVSTGGQSSRSRSFGRSRNRGARAGGRSGNQSGQQDGSGSSGTRGGFQQRIQQIVDRAAQGDFEVLGETKIIPDSRTNKLIVFANKEDMKMINRVIDKLDKVQSQVLIEAVIMEVAISNSRSLGVSFFQSPQKSGNVTGAGGVNSGQQFFDFQNFAGAAVTNGVANLPSGFNYFGQVGDDLDIAVNAIARSSDAKILQRPRIQTSHAVPAFLFVGETRPFVTGTIFGNTTGFGSTSQTIQRQDIGVDLQVLPLINPEGLVVMEIRQLVEDIGGTVQIDGNPVPITTTREAEATVAVQDGETIILGGMISDSKNISDSGVPILKDIPLLGQLFSSSDRDKERKELIVLIRPKVLETPTVANETAQEQLDRLPGVEDMKEEFEEERRKRREQKLDEGTGEPSEGSSETSSDSQ